MDFQFIASDEALENVCADLLGETIICVDLEADSMHCFKEKICLIQIATTDRAFLIDPFEFDSLAPFIRLLEDGQVKKVFHGADFDVRSLDRDYGVRIRNLFDTEIACRFLGIRERGLGALIKKYFDVDLDKRFQKVDWSKRPLKPDMIAYSVGDVAHLIALHDIICRSLEENGRMAWAQEEFEIQAAVRHENNHSFPLFRKFKGAGKMDNRTLAVLENLLQARMSFAQKKDQPLFKIISNQSLADMARLRPKSVEQMVDKRMLSQKQARMYGADCLAAIVSGLELPHGQLPAYPRTRRTRPDPVVKERVSRLKKMRDTLSDELGMEPGFLLNNNQISAIAGQNPETAEALLQIDGIRRWQVEAMAAKILATLKRRRG